MNISTIEKPHLKPNLPDMRPGDIVRVHQRIQEGDKSRVARFEGMIISRKHGTGISATFTVRKVVQEIGVERTFPLHGPTIEKIEVVRRPSRVRRAKLYFIREKAAKAIRKKMRQMRTMAVVTEMPLATPEPTPTEDTTENAETEGEEITTSTETKEAGGKE